MIRIRFTIRIDRPQPRQSDERSEHREVDVKGSYLLDRFHQAGPNDIRVGFPGPPWPSDLPDEKAARIGFQRNEGGDD